MTVVGIVAEYNPFHLGHKYQIDKIREMFGKDTAVVAVMSGNYTQRGELAIFDKYTRAEAAVLAGVDLVLELPFPYSMSGAEFFARAGVSILDSLGVVDYLCFGSECADIEALKKAADALCDEILPKEESHDARGYADKCEDICKMSGISAEIFSPNNILGIEYIKAIKSLESNIVPITIKRIGAGYNEEKTTSKAFQSAMSIRSLLRDRDDSALDYIPNETKNTIIRALQNGEAPTDQSRLDTAVIASLRLNSPKASEHELHDLGGGLYNRIRNASFFTDNILSLTELVKTKKYTTARLRRAIWYSYLGVTSSDVRALPTYTRVLGMNASGCALLKRIKKASAFTVITKPSITAGLSEQVILAKAISDKADFVFQLSKPKTVRGDLALISSPFVKK